MPRCDLPGCGTPMAGCRKCKPDNRPRGAFGLTRVDFTPQMRRWAQYDVTSCPHCGGHHANVDGVLKDGLLTLHCPALGGRPIKITVKMFIHPVGG